MITKIVKNHADCIIEFEVCDGQLMANATSLCAAWGYDAMSWALANSTRRYFHFVQDSADFPAEILVKRRRGSNRHEDDVWTHESMVLRLAQWLDANPGLLQQHTGYQGYVPAKVEQQCEKWLAQFLPQNRVELLRRKHIEVLCAERQLLG